MVLAILHSLAHHAHTHKNAGDDDQKQHEAENGRG